jgi:hypothetical protein
MTILTDKQRKNLVNKTFGLVQVIIGLGIPVEIGSLQFNTYNNQSLQKRKRKGPKKAFAASYDKELLMEINLLKKGAYGKFTVGKQNIKKEELDNSINVLTTR